MNADKCGDHRFILVKRTEDVAMYRRERLDGIIKSYEVFIVKKRYKGDPLPGGNVESEDRECYPGSASFGKIAFDCKTEDRAEVRYEELIKKVNLSNQAKEEAVKSGKSVKRGRKAKTEVKVEIPRGRFTVKMMTTDTGYSQPVIYQIVRKWVDDGIIKVVGEFREEGARGRAQVLYDTV